MEIEIFFDDLNEETQQKVLKAAGISDPKDANWDVFPLTVICV